MSEFESVYYKVVVEIEEESTGQKQYRETRGTTANEIETTQKLHPCIYIVNDGDTSNVRPTGTNGTMYLVYGTGYLGEEIGEGKRIAYNLECDDEVEDENGAILWKKSGSTEYDNVIVEEFEVLSTPEKVTAHCSKLNELLFGSSTQIEPTVNVMNYRYDLLPDEHLTGFNFSYKFNLPVFFSYNQANIYADTGEGDPDIEAEPDEKEKDDDDDASTIKKVDDDDLDDNTIIRTPTYNPLKCGGAINAYVMDADELSSVFSWFWNSMIDTIQADDMLAYIQGIYGNMSETLISVTIYPFQAPASANIEHVQLGRYVSPLERYKLDVDRQAYNLVFEKSYKINRIRNNFLDYEPYTKLYLYLPYVGLKNIDVATYMGRTVKIQYLVDYTTGALDVWLSIGDTIFDHFTGKAGADVPFTLDSGKSLKSFAIDSALNVATQTISSGAQSLGSAIGGAAGPVGSMIGGAVGGMAGNYVSDFTRNGMQHQSNTQHFSGISSNSNILNSPNKVQIFYVTSDIYYPNDKDFKKFREDYGHANGFPYRRPATLKTVKGFTTCENVEIEYGNTKIWRDPDDHSKGQVTVYPTDSEAVQIKQFLESGVYL